MTAGIEGIVAKTAAVATATGQLGRTFDNPLMNLDTDPLPPLVPLARLLENRQVNSAATTAQVEFDVSEDWLQGRTAFGGLTSALGVQAMRDVPAHDSAAGFSLRALQTSFVGPLGAGPASVEALLLRGGKNVRQIQATVRQHGGVAAVMLGVFAKDRESSMQTVRPLRPAPSHDPQTLPRRPYVAEAEPAFIRHFDMRWDDGPMPGSSSAGLSTRIHMRMIDGEGLDDDIASVVMADVSPTPASGQFRRRAPASSISWALELRPLRCKPAADGWWRADNDSLVVEGGYVNHAARLWAPSGELAALAYQVVALYG